MLSLANPSPSDRSSAVADVRGLIERGLKSSFWRLSLPDGLEQRYLHDAIEARVLHTQHAGWFALLVFNSFLLVDWLMVRDVFWNSVLIRVGLFTPAGVLTLLAGRQLAKLSRDKGWVNMADWMSMISGWLAALSLAAILLQSHSPWAHYYHAGFLVIIIYGNLVQQLRFPFAVAFSVLVLALHGAGMLIAESFPPGVRTGTMLMLCVATAFTLVANYLMEKATRRRYLLARRDEQMVDELSAVKARLQALSRSDVLTGVANRRHFQGQLGLAFERARADGAPLSLLMLDVDHFKAYNDRYGHPAGDECLRQVARALQEGLRHPSDLVARFGGEEFVIVMQLADQAAAVAAAERVRAAIESLGLRHEGSTTSAVVTASVGTATLAPFGDITSSDKLVSCADQALYEAKRAGRNRVQTYREMPG